VSGCGREEGRRDGLGTQEEGSANWRNRGRPGTHRSGGAVEGGVSLSRELEPTDTGQAGRRAKDAHFGGSVQP